MMHGQKDIKLNHYFYYLPQRVFFKNDCDLENDLCSF